MEAIVFDVEYHSDTPELTDQLKAKAERRLRKLSRGNKDLTGASIAVVTDSGTNSHSEYRVRVVVYKRPNNVAVTEKGDSVSAVLTDALASVERLVREQREKQRHGWKKP